jgi:hypothetical protein
MGARELAEMTAAHEVDAAISEGRKIRNREAVIKTAVERIRTKDRQRLDWAVERNNEYLAAFGLPFPTSLLVDYVSTGNSRGLAPYLRRLRRIPPPQQLPDRPPLHPRMPHPEQTRRDGNPEEDQDRRAEDSHSASRSRPSRLNSSAGNLTSRFTHTSTWLM